MKEDSMLEEIAYVMDSLDEAELMLRMENLSKKFGFEKFLLGIEIKRPLVDSIQYIGGIYPDAWMFQYMNKKYIEKDPTVIHCRTQTSLLHWNETMHVSSRDLWEDAKLFGISHGVSIPIHEVNGVKSMISLTRDKELEAGDLQSIAGAKILASSAHFAASRLLVPNLIASKNPNLTNREQECLKWAAAGKTTTEIGDILNITAPTVNFHLNNVMRKLQVHSRQQAIALGVALGIIN